MTFKGICNGHVFSDCCNGVLDNGRCRTCGEFSENQCSSCGENCRERSTSLFADGGVHRHVKWFLADAPVVFPSYRRGIEKIYPAPKSFIKKSVPVITHGIDRAVLFSLVVAGALLLLFTIINAILKEIK